MGVSLHAFSLDRFAPASNSNSRHATEPIEAEQCEGLSEKNRNSLSFEFIRMTR